jgi:hypothetical protein
MRLVQFGVRVTPAVQPAAVLARCADAIVESDPVSGQVRVYVDRLAPSPADAVVAVVRDLDAAGAVAVAAVSDDDLITLDAVAVRMGQSRRTAGDLLHDGPPPLWHCAGEPVYRWVEVAARLRIPGDAASARVLAATNLALRLRTVTRDDPALAPIRGLVAQ